MIMHTITDSNATTTADKTRNRNPSVSHNIQYKSPLRQHVFRINVLYSQSNKDQIYTKSRVQIPLATKSRSFPLPNARQHENMWKPAKIMVAIAEHHEMWILDGPKITYKHADTHIDLIFLYCCHLQKSPLL